MSQTNSKLIGVIGGMGPLSSVQFYDDLIKYSQKQLGVFYNKDYPHILISNLPVPDLINDTSQNEISRQMVIDEIQMMEVAGAETIALACNTMHLYIDEFQEKANVPVLNILTETAMALQLKGKHKAGILATPTTINHGLYQKALEQKGVGYVIPEEKEIAELGNIILLILGGKNTNLERQKLLEIVKHMVEKGVDSILLGCTELGIVLKQEDVPVEIVNSITELSHSVAEISTGKR
jgi:aspartate racemase